MLFPMGSDSRVTKDEEVQFPARAYEGGERPSDPFSSERKDLVTHALDRLDRWSNSLSSALSQRHSLNEDVRLLR